MTDAADTRTAPDAAAATDLAADEAALLAAPFITELLRQMRAADSIGRLAKKSDRQLLAPYLPSAEQRRSLPLLADPDAQTLWRLELFYNAVALSIERASGLMVSQMLTMHHEGFGRVVLIAGRLVVVNKQLRDVHRFGFSALATLASAGDKLVSEGLAMIQAYPDAARHGA